VTDYTSGAVDYLSRKQVSRHIPSPQEVGEAMVRAIAAGDLVQTVQPVEHLRAGRVYVRHIFCKAGDLIVTMRHKSEHVTEAVKGECFVADGKSEPVRIVAPKRWVTQPGTMRTVYCVTDVEWSTHHDVPIEIQDIDEVERFLADDTFAEQKKMLEALA
jgi:hypothetical protein